MAYLRVQLDSGQWYESEDSYADEYEAEVHEVIRKLFTNSGAGYLSLDHEQEKIYIPVARIRQVVFRRVD